MEPGVEDSQKPTGVLARSNLRRGGVGTSAEREQIEHSLRERVKELSCLYGISQLIAEHPDSTEKLFQGVTELLPPSWQYPEITCARVVFAGTEYLTANFETSQWRQTATIEVEEEQVGAVEVYYLEERPRLDEGPFLSEERLLINAVAERIGRAAQHIRAEQLLQAEKTALARANIALQEVLARVEEQKREIGLRVETNIHKVIMPILYDLESRASADERGYVGLLKRHLEEIASPFSSNLSKKFMALSPTEIQLCNMIRSGLSSKEIAQIRHISPATVSRHRESIRRKLGITNKGDNLTTFLSAFMSE